VPTLAAVGSPFASGPKVLCQLRPALGQHPALLLHAQRFRALFQNKHALALSTVRLATVSRDIPSFKEQAEKRFGHMLLVAREHRARGLKPSDWAG